MDKQRDGYPNITLEQAKELLVKQHRQLDIATAEKYKAQNIAFDYMFPEFRIGDAEVLKAQVYYFKTELNEAIAKRDSLKQEVNELRAENNLLKVTLKKYERSK